MAALVLKNSQGLTHTITKFAGVGNMPMCFVKHKTHKLWNPMYLMGHGAHRLYGDALVLEDSEEFSRTRIWGVSRVDALMLKNSPGLTHTIRISPRRRTYAHSGEAIRRPSGGNMPTGGDRRGGGNTNQFLEVSKNPLC